MSVPRKLSSDQRPLFRIIEDNYKQQNLLPELEKRKAVLAKKREMYSPLDHEEMQDHMHQHRQTFDEMASRRR